MLSTLIRLTKFGPGFWFRVPGVGPGFYSFPRNGLQRVPKRKEQTLAHTETNFNGNQKRNDPNKVMYVLVDRYVGRYYVGRSVGRNVGR